MKNWYVGSKREAAQGLVIEEGTGRNVAVTYDAADAVLVAAAPNLLATCKTAIDLLNYKAGKRGKWTCKDQNTYEQLASAIRQAEGRE